MMRQVSGGHSARSSSDYLLALMAVTIAIGVALAISGCGNRSRPGTAHLEGTITIGGQPVPADAQASLTFTPMSGGRSAGAAVSGGRYVCPDAPVGKVKLFAHILRPTGRMLTESDNRPYPEVASIVDTKYAAGIDIEISGDNSSQDFDLQSAQQ